MLMTKTPPAPVPDDALAILNRLGVPESALARHGLPARSPITGEVVAHLRETTPEEASAAIGRAHQAFLTWRQVPAPRRGELVRLAVNTSGRVEMVEGHEAFARLGGVGALLRYRLDWQPRTPQGE